MKKGDTWNWAFVTAAVLVLCVNSFMLYYQISVEAIGRPVNKMAYGFSSIVIPLWVAPCLLAITGVLSLFQKSSIAVLGAVIGVGLYFPCLLAAMPTGLLAELIPGMPRHSGVFVLPIGLLIWAVLKRPKEG